jgi:hypothetical protein
VDRDPGVFVAPRSLERAIGTWLLSRGGFSVSPEHLVELTLVAPGRGRVVVRRVAGELAVQKGTQGFDAARLEELLAALEGLRPDAALHLGAPAPGEGFRRPTLTAVIRTRSQQKVGLSTRSLSIGSRDSVLGSSVYYARSGAANASYALPSHQVRRLLELF